MSTGSAGGSRSDGVDRGAGHGHGDVAGDRRPAVDRLAPPVAHPAEPVRADGDPQRAAAEGDARCRAGRMPPVPSRTCTTARSRSASRTSPCRVSPSPSLIVANSSQPTPVTPRTTSSGPRSSATAVYSRRAQAAHAARPVLALRRAQLPVEAGEHRPLSGGDRFRRARLFPGPQDRGEVLALHAPRATPAPASSRQRAATASTASPSAAALALPQKPSTGLSALCCSTPSLISRPPRIAARSAGGRAATPISSASALSRSASASSADSSLLRRAHPASPARPARRPPRPRRGRTTRTRRRPGSAARRRDRGQVTTGRGRNAGCTW